MQISELQILIEHVNSEAVSITQLLGDSVPAGLHHPRRKSGERLGLCCAHRLRVKWVELFKMI